MCVTYVLCLNPIIQVKNSYLHSDKLFRRIRGLPPHLAGFNDSDNHLTTSFDGLESSSGRGVMIIFYGLDLFKNFSTDTANLLNKYKVEFINL